MGPGSLFLLGSGLCVAIFLAAWWPWTRSGRESLVDVLWTLMVAGLGFFYAAAGSGWGPRRTVIALMAMAWGLRLAQHLHRRLKRDAGDGRYQAMRAAAGARYPAFMLGFFLMQALVSIGLSLPYFFIAQDPHPAWRLLDLAGAALWLLGLGMESLADAQLARWRRDPVNAGRTCRAGLWNWSRHPNYFGEWLTWCGIALIAWPAPYGWTGAAAAAFMLILVLFVSGIPYTERQALRSRGEDYRRYQRTTSAFIPLPPRSERSA